MNKPILLLGLGLSALNATLAAESAENLASAFRGLPVHEQTMANLPKDREQEVLAALVKRQAVYREVLLRLNHEPAVKRFFENYLARESMSAGDQRIIADCGSPYIIDELAPLLYSTDKIFLRTWGEHADMDWGPAAGTAVLIGKIIQKAPEFSPEIKAWAKEMLSASIYDPPPRSDIIQITRAWWELNQAALLANQFDQVKVPESSPKAPAAPPPIPDASTAPDTPAPLSTAVEPVVAPAQTISPKPKPVPVSPPPPESSHRPWWIACLVTALAAIGFLARRQKSKR